MTLFLLRAIFSQHIIKAFKPPVLECGAVSIFQLFLERWRDYVHSWCHFYMIGILFFFVLKFGARHRWTAKLLIWLNSNCSFYECKLYQWFWSDWSRSVSFSPRLLSPWLWFQWRLEDDVPSHKLWAEELCLPRHHSTDSAFVSVCLLVLCLIPISHSFTVVVLSPSQHSKELLRPPLLFH